MGAQGRRAADVVTDYDRLDEPPLSDQVSQDAAVNGDADVLVEAAL